MRNPIEIDYFLEKDKLTKFAHTDVGYLNLWRTQGDIHKKKKKNSAILFYVPKLNLLCVKELHFKMQLLKEIKSNVYKCLIWSFKIPHT